MVRAFKTVLDTLIEPISFIVPRRSELFQLDIYPDCPSTTPALSAQEWFDGKEVNGPVLINMEAIYEGTEPRLKDSKPVTKISEAKEAKNKDLEKQKEEAGKKKKEKEETSKEKEKEKETLSGNKSDSTKGQSHSTETVSSLSGTPDKNVDELLQSSNEVGDLLNKVAEQSDDEDASGADETRDDGWEEVKKPNVKDTDVSEEKDKQEKKNLDDEKSTKSSTTRPTLASTIEKLSNLVSQFESQIVKLEQANLDKDERLKILEEKIETLLKK